VEETGIVIPVGEWVLRTACEQARAWEETDDLLPLRVAVNLSTRQFKRHDLTETISRVLRLTGLDPRRLELEITESILMENAQTSGVKLAKLKTDEGIRVSIDDFGTGYSSLSYLKRFPLDVLKIDQSFVRDIADDPDNAAIVSAIIALAHNLRLEVIAEGVETEAQLSYLRERGCDQIQGFYFSRPLPPDAFIRLVREGRASPQA
jgi:EAL domain-containing protein (putative c-di-GMP-specific phosphodiesterase class I)